MQESNGNEGRAPNMWEAFVIELAASVLDTEVRRQLVAQLRGCCVKPIDDQGQLSIQPARDAERLNSIDRFPLDIWYFDSDGMIVSMLLHVDAEKKQMSMLERYRPDGGRIKLLWPQIDQLRVGPPLGERD